MYVFKTTKAICICKCTLLYHTDNNPNSCKPFCTTKKYKNTRNKLSINVYTKTQQNLNKLGDENPLRNFIHDAKFNSSHAEYNGINVPLACQFVYLQS